MCIVQVPHSPQLPPASHAPPPLPAASRTPALGGAGVFAKTNGQTVLDYAQPALRAGGMDWALVMVGVNDLLSLGKTAKEIWEGGLQDLYDEVRGKGARIVAMLPLPTGLVTRWGTDQRGGVVGVESLAAIITVGRAAWPVQHVLTGRSATRDPRRRGSREQRRPQGQGAARAGAPDLRLLQEVVGRIPHLLVSSLIWGCRMPAPQSLPGTPRAWPRLCSAWLYPATARQALMYGCGSVQARVPI